MQGIILAKWLPAFKKKQVWMKIGENLPQKSAQFGPFLGYLNLLLFLAGC